MLSGTGGFVGTGGAGPDPAFLGDFDDFPVDVLLPEELAFVPLVALVAGLGGTLLPTPPF